MPIIVENKHKKRAVALVLIVMVITSLTMMFMGTIGVLTKSHTKYSTGKSNDGRLNIAKEKGKYICYKNNNNQLSERRIRYLANGTPIVEPDQNEYASGNKGRQFVENCVFIIPRDAQKYKITLIGGGGGGGKSTIGQIDSNVVVAEDSLLIGNTTTKLKRLFENSALSDELINGYNKLFYEKLDLYAKYPNDKYWFSTGRKVNLEQYIGYVLKVNNDDKKIYSYDNKGNIKPFIEDISKDGWANLYINGNMMDGVDETGINNLAGGSHLGFRYNDNYYFQGSVISLEAKGSKVTLKKGLPGSAGSVKTYETMFLRGVSGGNTDRLVISKNDIGNGGTAGVDGGFTKINLNNGIDIEWRADGGMRGGTEEFADLSNEDGTIKKEKRIDTDSGFLPDYQISADFNLGELFDFPGKSGDGVRATWGEPSSCEIAFNTTPVCTANMTNVDESQGRGNNGAIIIEWW